MILLKINRLSNIPIYEQIYEQIKLMIVNNEISHHDALPTETEFLDIYNISAFTVKKAYMMLNKEHLIYRIKGKGTFVNRKPIFKKKVVDYRDLIDPFANEKTSKKIISIEKMHCDRVVARKKKTKNCIAVKQVIIDANNVVLAVQNFYLEIDTFKQIIPTLKNGEECDIVGEITKKKIAYVDTIASANNAENSLANLLKIENGKAVHSISIFFINDQDEVLAYLNTKTPGEYLSLEVSI